MWRNPVLGNRDVKSILACPGRVALVIACLLMPILSSAQAASGTLLIRSGLHTISEGHEVWVTVSEVGAREAVSRVVITLFDAADHGRSRAEGVLRRGVPVRLRLALAPGTGHVQLRAAISIARGAGSDPVAVLETVAQDGTVSHLGDCAGPPVGPIGPGIVPCPGFVLIASAP